MRRVLPSLLVLPLLAACAQSRVGTDRAELLNNPLFAQAYHDALVEQITALQLENDTSLKDVEDRVDALKQQALADSREAKDAQETGWNGQLIAIRAETEGEVLVQGNMLWFGPEFYTSPGIDLRVYLSAVIDPRDVPFPSDSDIDLGPLPSPFGAQAMVVPKGVDMDLRTVILWDAALKRVHGFAQVSRVKEASEN